MLSEQDIRERLRAAVAAAGSQQAFARQCDISAQYINDVLRGRREPGQKILTALGVERVVTYRELAHNDRDTNRDTASSARGDEDAEGKENTAP
jgi:transcriptional regulator with XRE-family HTH domain